MKTFNREDVKSWHNYNDIVIGDEGYFADDLLILNEIISRGEEPRILKEIISSKALCFVPKRKDKVCGFPSGFAFFSPPISKLLDNLKSTFGEVFFILLSQSL